ncbi:MAG: ComF family protein [Planctomycetes bacterium]|nr:ComF family protein [Planctomycetota bacterium]
MRRLLVQAKDMSHGAQAWALAYAVLEQVASLSISQQAVWTTPPPSRKRQWRDWYLPEFLVKQICKQNLYQHQQLLRRLHQTKDQADLDGAARRANLQGAFCLKRGLQGRRMPKEVILFDDVSTTGATLMEAASALRANGVEEIHAISVAVVP